MATARRALWEFIIFGLLIAAAAGIWQWKAWESRRALDETVASHQAAMDTLRSEQAERLSSQATGEAESVARALAAGMGPAVRAGRDESLEQAKNAALAQIERVTFIHLLRADGSVIVTSDDKFAASGTADQRFVWDPANVKSMSRNGTQAGRIEIAVPFAGQEGAEQILWVGYDIAALTAAP